MDKSDNDIFIKIKRIVFGTIGAVIIIVTIINSFFNLQFIKHAESAKGIVTALNFGGSHPEIMFTTKDGKEIKYPQGGFIGGYKLGDEVTVYYESGNPDNCVVNTFGALWGFRILGFLLGVGFLYMSLFIKSIN